MFNRELETEGTEGRWKGWEWRGKEKEGRREARKEGRGIWDCNPVKHQVNDQDIYNKG